MKSLYFLYGLTTQTLAYRGAKDLRFTPFFLITLLLQPVINSILGILMGPRYERLPIESVNANFYTRVDAWFYMALALTSLLVWFLFDRRRYNIINQWPRLEGTLIFKLRYVVILSVVLFAILLSYLSHQNYWLSIAAFSSAALAASLVVRTNQERQK